MKDKKWTKVALAFSVCLFIAWWALGTGATLAWFSDSDTVRNEFRVGLIDLNVSFRNDIVEEYTPLQGTTKAFNDEALYEPGYTQVVWLKIENGGEVDFKYKFAVTVENVIRVLETGENEVFVDEAVRRNALPPLERMLGYAK